MTKKKDVKYKDLVKSVMRLRILFEKFEKKTVGKVWGREELMMGLVTDVGDLSRLILIKEGFRKSEIDVDEALRHELADCFWAIIVLSEKYDIDLSEALQDMCLDLTKKLKKKNV